MAKKFVLFSILLVFAFSSIGCTTIRRKNIEQESLKDQISSLQLQLQEKDRQLESCRDSLASEMKMSGDLSRRASKSKTIPEVKSRPNKRQIQIALKNAGYSPGPIDGKIGRRTREAIRAFQRANGLQVDGKVGKKTWALLRGFLYTKSK